MESSTEVAPTPVDFTEPAECLEVTPCIEPVDFLDGVASLLDSTAQNPYTEQMLKDGLSYADIDYFVKQYSDIENVKYEKVHCTVCNKHIGTAVETTERFPHPLLKVVTCENCYMFYCSGDFETDKDGSELYCRWCGEGGQVFCCSKCPYVFCKKCIARNLGKNVAPQIECMEDWLCFNCNPCQISKLRAMCWALMKYSEEVKQIAETNPQLKTQNFTDYSTCCKSKRAASKAAKEPAAKKQKTENSKAKTQKSNSIEIVDSPPVWDNPAGPVDEVTCTPDIMPFDDSPPGTPPEMVPIEYAPPPGQRGLDAPPNVPIIKKIIEPSKPKTLKTIAPKPAPKPVPKPAPKSVKENIPIIKVINQKSEPSSVVPTTQKITVPVQKGNVNSDEQWFGTAVIRSAEVTEYISSKVSLLAFMNSSEELTDEKKEEIYRTFQSHLDIAIAKLKNIKQNMTSSYKRLLSKQQIILSGNTLKIVPASAVQAMQTQASKNNSEPKTPVQNSTSQSLLTEVTPKSQPTRSSVRRRKSYSYIESTSEEENYEDDEDSSDDFMETRKKTKKKRTPKKTDTPAKQPELVKIVDISSIVKSVETLKTNTTPIVTPKPAAMPTARIENNKIILDVIDLVDDDSNDAVDKKGDSDEGDIDSDVPELLPDHLLEENSQTLMKNPPKKPNFLKQDGPIEIDDSDVEEVDEKKNDNEIEKTESPKEKPNSNDKKTEDNLKTDGETKKIEDIEEKQDEEEKESDPLKDKEASPKNEDSNLSNCDENSQSSVPKAKEDNEKMEEDSIVTNDENSQTSTKSKQNNDNVEKIDCNDSNLNDDTNLSEKVEKADDNSRSCDMPSESKSPQRDNDETMDNTDSITKSESEVDKKVDQNGECSNDSSKVPNDMSDNAVDCDINKNGIEETKKPTESEDVEEFSDSNVIKDDEKEIKYEDEYSKFISNSKSSFDDELSEELDDALSLPPQNSLAFALGLKEKDVKEEKKLKNGKSGADEDAAEHLNVLRKLAESVLGSDMETNDSSA